MQRYGLNKIETSSKLNVLRCSNMPFFYVVLLVICAGVGLLDYYVNEYEYWYIQGSMMLFMLLFTMLIFGCGRVRFSKREIQSAEESHLKSIQKPLPAMVTRNGVQMSLPVSELTVGDKILLSAGDTVPTDCLVLQSQNQLIVDESLATGEPEGVSKKNVNHFNQMVLSNETVVFAQSKIIKGNAFAVVLTVGGNSSAARDLKRRRGAPSSLVEEEEYDHLDKHYTVNTIFIVLLVCASSLLVVHCGLSEKIEWLTAILVGSMMLVYGFPYILSVPVIWDMSLNAAKRQMAEAGVRV